MPASFIYDEIRVIKIACRGLIVVAYNIVEFIYPISLNIEQISVAIIKQSVYSSNYHAYSLHYIFVNDPNYPFGAI